MPTPGKDPEKYDAPAGTRNIRRTISILRAVAKYQGKGSQLSRIARVVDLPISTTKRILNVLSLEGILTYHQGSRQFYLGRELYAMVKPMLHSDLKDKYHASLERIAVQTQDSVYLVVPSGMEAICIDVAEGALAVRIPYGVGSVSPLGLMSSGLAILAALPEEETEAVLTKNKAGFDEYNLSVKEIRRQISKYRRQGYILYKSHYIEGLIGVSIPILDHLGRVIASVTDSSTEQRMSAERVESIKELINSELAQVD